MIIGIIIVSDEMNGIECSKSLCTAPNPGRGRMGMDLSRQNLPTSLLWDEPLQRNKRLSNVQKKSMDSTKGKRRMMEQQRLTKTLVKDRHNNKRQMGTNREVAGKVHKYRLFILKI